MGLGLTLLRQGLVLGSTMFQRRMLVSLEISNQDRAYTWFLAWMAQQSSAQSRLRTVKWFRSPQLSVNTDVVQRKNGSSSAAISLVAGPGTHWFRYRGAWMQVSTSTQFVIGR